jgi:DNA-binding FrmR family transcriptional regulator
VEEKILDRHFRHCVNTVVKGNSEKQKQEKLDEILKLISQARRG